nr:hypothetical protein [Tanacetum cinerariifolium]
MTKTRKDCSSTLNLSRNIQTISRIFDATIGELKKDLIGQLKHTLVTIMIPLEKSYPTTLITYKGKLKTSIYMREIEKRLNESKMQTQEGMVNEGIASNAGLDSEASTDDNTSTEQQDGSSSSRYATDVERA